LIDDGFSASHCSLDEIKHSAGQQYRHPWMTSPIDVVLCCCSHSSTADRRQT
jgi:hypothetical protein